MSIKRTLFVSSIVVVLTLLGCSSPPPTPTPMPTATATSVPTATPTPAQLIIGKWKQVNGTATFRFFQTGELLQTNVGLLGPVDIQGTYRFLAPATIRVDFKDLFGSSETWDLRFNGDRMTVSGSFGSMEYARTQ